MNARDLHALLLTANQLDDAGVRRMFARTPASFWHHLKRLHNLGGQVMRGGGAEDQGGIDFLDRLLTLDTLTQLAPCIVRGLAGPPLSSPPPMTGLN